MNIQRVSGQVHESIKRIVANMTIVDAAQRNAIYDSAKENFNVREAKKECIHVIEKDGRLTLTIDRIKDGPDKGCLFCTVCGRTINTKFNADAVDTLMNAVKIVNGLAFFGMLNGLKAEPLQTLIAVKTVLPAIAQLQSELNAYVNKVDKANDAIGNIGDEYRTPDMFNSITTMGQ